MELQWGARIGIGVTDGPRGLVDHESSDRGQGPTKDLAQSWLAKGSETAVFACPMVLGRRFGQKGGLRAPGTHRTPVWGAWGGLPKRRARKLRSMAESSNES